MTGTRAIPVRFENSEPRGHGGSGVQDDGAHRGGQRFEIPWLNGTACRATSGYDCSKRVPRLPKVVQAGGARRDAEKHPNEQQADSAQSASDGLAY